MEWTQSPDETEWLTRWADTPDASYFQHPAWARALARHVPGYRVAVLQGTPAGREVFMPFIRRDRWAGHSLYAMPWLTTGGPLLGRETMDQPLADVLARAVRAARPATAFVAWPAAEQAPAWSLPGFQRQERATQVLMLDADHETLFEQRFQGRLRTAVRKAVSEEVRVQAYDQDRTAHVEHVVAAYWSLAARRMHAREGEGLTAALLSDLLAAPGAVLWTAWLDRELLAGMLVLYGQREAFWWHGVLDRRYAATQPNAALMDAVVRDAVQRGLTRLNLGASTGLPGVFTFKASTGAVEQTVCIDSLARGPYRLARWLRRGP